MCVRQDLRWMRPYASTSSMPWNVERVVHLHRRTGFAASWDRILKDIQQGPDASIDRVLNVKAAPEFETMSSVICDAAVGSGDITRLKAWWLYRMLFTPDPLTERLTLCWHNHFATSNAKINDVALMRNQNELLRTFARGKFSDLLKASVKEPTMLIWLDADANRKGHPNENLAREVMELFSLGVGNYSENDVQEAARTLTGWNVVRTKFRFDEKFHDDADKTVLGKTGKWNGDDLLKMLSEHPATAKRLAFRLCEHFFGESVANEEVIDELAAGLRERELDIDWAVDRIVRSELFFSDANIRSRVVGAVEFLIGTARSLEINSPPPSTWLLAEWSKRLGQDLFSPPNVFGWLGGRAWLTSRSIIARANFAVAISNGECTAEKRPFDAKKLAEKYGFVKPKEVGGFYAILLLGRQELSEQWSSLVGDPQRLVVALLGSSEGQIG